MTKSFSRSAVDLFCECPRCFYLQLKFGLKRPPGYPFTLNTAVDRLTKAEFDLYRKKGMPHPIMVANGLNLVPLKHASIEDWRNNRRGVRTLFRDYEFYGVVDDVWSSPNKSVWHVVDYKATAKKDVVTELDDNAEHHQSYQRQVSFYTWLMRQNGHPVSDCSYFVYSTGDNQLGAFNNQLLFRTNLIAYQCDTSWIEPTLTELIQCYESDQLPNSSDKCSYCAYQSNANNLVKLHGNDNP
jgi:hypothetical protein